MLALIRAFDRIGTFPNSAPVTIVIGSRSYHAALAGNYLIYYQVVDEWAVIARIRDARRDVTGFDPGSSKV
jgi:plasmid stabilization system protein ParE